MKGIHNAWISPEGEFHGTDYMGHNEWAADYFADHYGLGSFDKIDEINESPFGYPYEALHKLGWIRLLTLTDSRSLCLGESPSNKYIRDTVDPNMNEKQKKTMMKWSYLNNYLYSDLFKS